VQGIQYQIYAVICSARHYRVIGLALIVLNSRKAGASIRCWRLAVTLTVSTVIIAITLTNRLFDRFLVDGRQAGSNGAISVLELLRITRESAK